MLNCWCISFVRHLPSGTRLRNTQMHSERLTEIWKQREIPVILRRDGPLEKHRLRVPESFRDCLDWLNSLGKGRKPNGRMYVAWRGEYWEIPKTWFNNFVNGALQRYGKVYVIQPYNEQEKCAPACMNAVGHICQCSCMGAHHGMGNDGSWFEVSETFATRWHGRELACRLMHAKQAKGGCENDW